MDGHLQSLIKKSGLKYTKHRAAILELLGQNDQPVTAEQLYSEMLAKSIPVNFSTVYRTLDTLCEKDLVTKLTIEGGSRALFEFNNNLHRHHLICLGCKKIMTLENCPLGDYEQTLENNTHFVITGHKLDIYGYCPNCRLPRKSSNR
jgi:Fur family ferric uptake transcriptional regulator